MLIPDATGDVSCGLCFVEITELDHAMRVMGNGHVLEIPMIADMPMSAWYACRYHMAEKSPAVQPTRQRRVLIEARFQVVREDQNAREVRGGGGDAHGWSMG